MTDVLSYDYRHFDADVATAEKDLTGTFKKHYRDAQVQTVRAPALQYKATVKADVVAAGAIDVKSPQPRPGPGVRRPDLRTTPSWPRRGSTAAGSGWRCARWPGAGWSAS